jgi:site-specific DNA-methyltransferase (adenine-specific)
MTPYYEHAGITIYHGDALELASELPQADVLILDPPFFMPAQHYAARSEWARSWGDTAILARWFAGALDVISPLLKGTGSAFTFCDDESYPVFYPALYTRFPALNSLIWNKGRIGMGSPWRHAHEFILHARRADAKWRGSGGETDVLAFSPTPSADRFHPVNKPVGLLHKLLAVTTDEADLVLDPFMGGGSTLEAAMIFNRRAIGIEIEERYCEIAAKRLSQEVLNLGGAA